MRLERGGWEEKHIGLRRLLGARWIHVCRLPRKFATLGFGENIWKGFLLQLPPFWFFIYDLTNSLIQRIFIAGTGGQSKEECTF